MTFWMLVAAFGVVWFGCGFIAAGGILGYFWTKYPDSAPDEWNGAGGIAFIGGVPALIAAALYTNCFCYGFRWSVPIEAHRRAARRKP